MLCMAAHRAPVPSGSALWSSVCVGSGEEQSGPRAINALNHLPVSAPTPDLAPYA